LKTGLTMRGRATGANFLFEVLNELRFEFHAHSRMADSETPAGLTISKTETLPDGDFIIDEYTWPQDNVTLWFVQADGFDEDERQYVKDVVTEWGGGLNEAFAELEQQAKENGYEEN